MNKLFENWRRYLNEYGEMPPKGHMPPPAGYSWSEKTNEFYDNVENLYSRYKIEKDIENLAEAVGLRVVDGGKK